MQADEVMNMPKTTFMFGSGADTDANCELRSGQSFAKALITEQYKKELKSLLGEQAAQYRFLYPTSTKVFVQTVVAFSEKAREVLGNDAVSRCQKYYEDKQSVEYGKIKELCKEWYKLITKDEKFSTAKERKIKGFFLENAVLCDSLDEKFNSLRFPDKYDAAKRIKNVYYSIFITMFRSLYEQDMADGFDWSLENILECLSRLEPIVRKEDCYYHLLRDSGIPCNVITTNYTSLAETETSNQEVVYLHGKLTWFEDLEDLSVYDCLEESERKHILEAKNVIPFILIPSGVKPLICTKQIREFAKFVNKLEESDILCVMGYKFNSEDNHINSIIAEWLRKDNKKLIYFNFKNSVDFDEMLWTQKLSREVISDSLDFEKLSTSSTITSISVSEDNCESAFREFLNFIAQTKNH